MHAAASISEHMLQPFSEGADEVQTGPVNWVTAAFGTPWSKSACVLGSASLQLARWLLQMSAVGIRLRRRRPSQRARPRHCLNRSGQIYTENGSRADADGVRAFLLRIQQITPVCCAFVSVRNNMIHSMNCLTRFCNLCAHDQ